MFYLRGRWCPHSVIPMVPVEALIKKNVICLPAGEWLVNSCVWLMLYQWELRRQTRHGVLLCPSDMPGSVQPLCPAHTISPAPIASRAILQGSFQARSPPPHLPRRTQPTQGYSASLLPISESHCGGSVVLIFFFLCDSLSDATTNSLRAGDILADVVLPRSPTIPSMPSNRWTVCLVWF